jgi:hypothetical protein
MLFSTTKEGTIEHTRSRTAGPRSDAQDGAGHGEDRGEDARSRSQAKEADLRAKEVRRRIEVGDVEPRPLPGMREDSLP